MNLNPTKAEDQLSLSGYYQYGLFDLPRDLDKAQFWLVKAAENGNARAQWYLGVCYDTGIHISGFHSDKEKAKYWYTKSAEQGYEPAKEKLKKLNSGCYVATCVYGSYDCHEVRTLRRYRDNKLSKSRFGRRFIQIYYTVSPKIVALFGNKKWFNRLCKPVLDLFVRKIQQRHGKCWLEIFNADVSAF